MTYHFWLLFPWLPEWYKLSVVIKISVLMLLIKPCLADFPVCDTSRTSALNKNRWKDLRSGRHVWGIRPEHQVFVCFLTLRRICLAPPGEPSSRRGGSRPSTPPLCDACSCHGTSHKEQWLYWKTLFKDAGDCVVTSEKWCMTYY